MRSRAYVIVEILILSLFLTLNAFHIGGRSKYKATFLKMDDETQRPGIKDDLTTRDEYLDTRFVKLSSSWHDLTPMTQLEIDEFDEHHPEYQTQCLQQNDNSNYLGEHEKGTYVHRVGGLPLFTSGYRLNTYCNQHYVVFTEPCDIQHIYDKTIEDKNRIIQLSNICNLLTIPLDTASSICKLVYCARTQFPIGYYIQSKSTESTSNNSYNNVNNISHTYYIIESQKMVFFPLHMKLPLPSQPENVWGTEGQYTMWKTQ